MRIRLVKTAAGSTPLWMLPVSFLHYAHMNKPAPAPTMGHRYAPMHDKSARVMHDKGHMGNHNMGNHNMGNHNAHKAPNREIAQNTRNNHGGSGHFGGRR